MKYTEDTLKGWCNPASNNEKEKIERTINMIKNAISNSSELNDLAIEVFVQGSYANNTNVRINSDVDVCIMLTSSVFLELPTGMDKQDYGYSDGTISFSETIKIRS